MISSFHNIPWSIAVIIAMGISFVLSAILTSIARRFYARFEDSIDRGIHIQTIEFSAVILGLLLGFAVLISQNWYDAADQAVATEANLIRNALRNADAFDPASKQKINAAFKEYVQYLLNEEWEFLETGKGSTNASQQYIKNIENVYLSIPINTIKENITYSTALDNLNLINNQRSLLEQLSSSALHPIIWHLILFFSLILIGFILTYPIKSAIYNFILIYIYILAVCLLLFFLYLLEFPFSGDIHISSESLTNLLENNFQESSQ